MGHLYDDVKKLLEQNETFCKSGKLFKNSVIEAALQLDPLLLKILLQDKTVKRHFFQDMDGVLVFDKIKFQKFISNKQFLPDSYTAYKNKIGLSADDAYLTEGKEVVLSWPFKDSVLEGAQTKEEQKRREIFWNETLAADEIDRLFEPKVLVNWKKYDKTGPHPVKRVFLKDNYIIKGNNLLTLHSLKKVFRGKIKLIYIDPPYNTGKDSFLYNDSFNHSSWLTFMKNRLEVSRKLLTQQGVIFISIDMNEQAYLKILCDEIFGRNNFVGEIIWETATDNNATQISVEHEYVLCYAKDKKSLPKWKIPSENAQHIINKYNALKRKYKNDIEKIERELRAWINSVKKSNEYDLSGVSHYCYVDDKGVFYPGNSANTKPGGYDFDIIHPVTQKICKKPAYGYRWPEKTFWNAEKEGNVLWGADETTIPKIKKRIETATELLKGYFYEDNRKSTQALAKQMGKKVFDNPKSINLLKKIIKFVTSENDIILDFFAGSGSTAQAVLEVNNEQDSNRTFILCEQMEYIHSVTIPRVQHCLLDTHFIYLELAALNEELISQITNCRSFSELQSLVKTVLKQPFVTYRLTDEIKNNLLNAAAADLPAVQRVLIELLDKNWLYIPLSEIEDNDFSIDEATKRLNYAFYHLQ